jgi:hypothetical protein
MRLFEKSWGVSGKASYSSSAASSRGDPACCKRSDTCDQTGWRICHAEFMGVLTEGLAGLGQLDTALVTVDKALARTEHSAERYAVPELLRIKGEVLLQQAANAPQSAAEDRLALAD